MQQKKRTCLDLEASLLSGSRIVQHEIPHHTWSSWIRALWRSIYVLSAFDAGQSGLAQAKLAQTPLAPSQPLQNAPLLRPALVRQDAAKLRVWLHLLCGARACYAESFALCAGLRMLGWNCTLVVGYAYLSLNSSAVMHAWVEYEGEVMNDRYDIPSGYQEIERRGLH